MISAGALPPTIESAGAAFMNDDLGGMSRAG